MMGWTDSVVAIRRALEWSFDPSNTECEHRTEGQTCGACEGCESRRSGEALAALDWLVETMRAKEGTFTVPTTSTGGEVFLRAHDPLACVCCQEAAGGLAAGRRAARTAKDLTQELLRVERALLPLTEDDTEAGERSPGDAVEHLVWQHSEACESERMLLEQVKDAGSKMADQQAIHETEMDQDGRARAMMVALCRDLGVSIYTDATRGIRDEMHRRKALLRRCFDWWGQDDVGRLVYADLCRNFGVPVDEPGICSTGLTAEPVDSRSSNPSDLQDTERSS